MEQEMFDEEKRPIDARECEDVVVPEQPAVPNMVPNMIPKSDTESNLASNPITSSGSDDDVPHDAIDATVNSTITTAMHEPVVDMAGDSPATEHEPGIRASIVDPSATVTPDAPSIGANMTAPTVESNESRSRADTPSPTPSVYASECAPPAPTSSHDIADPSERMRTSAPPGLFHLPTLHHFTSSYGVDRVLEQLVENPMQENRKPDHILLHGRAGSGTTLVARALVHDLAPDHCVELDVLDGVDAALLQSAIREVRNGGVLLIRHIELLDTCGERMLMDCIARKTTIGTGRFAPNEESARPRRGMKPRLDDADVFSGKPKRAMRPIATNFTLIATAHATHAIGYQLRNRFDHMIHLRKDPVGIRMAICRTLARDSVHLEPDAHALVERFVQLIGDSAEQLTRAIIARAEIEGIRPSKVRAGHLARSAKHTQRIVANPAARSIGDPAACDTPPIGKITRDLMQSIIVRDMPCRLPDEVYAHALFQHLADRRVVRVSDAEVTRIDLETGWGETVVRAALAIVLRAYTTRPSKPAA